MRNNTGIRPSALLQQLNAVINSFELKICWLCLFKTKPHIYHVAEVNKLFRLVPFHSRCRSSFYQSFPQHLFVCGKRNGKICVPGQLSPAFTDT